MQYLNYVALSLLALSGATSANAVDQSDLCDALCEVELVHDASMAAAIAFEDAMNKGQLASLIKTQGLLRYACDLGSISLALDEPIREEVERALQAQLGSEDRHGDSIAARKWAIADQVHQGFVFGYSMGFASANTARFKAAGSAEDQEHEQELSCVAATRFANRLLEDR